MKSQRFEWSIAGWMWMVSFSSSPLAIASVPLSFALLPQSAVAQAPTFDYEDFDFWAEQCRLLEAAGEYEIAVTSCERAISLEPNEANLELWSARAASQFQLGHYVEALVSYQQITEERPEDSLILTYQCAALVQLDEFEAALETCEIALQADNWGEQSPLPALYYKGLALQGLELWQSALETFSQAWVFNPTDPRLEAEICVLAEELDQWSGCSLGQAAVAYDRALAAEPQNFLLWYRQGLILEQLGRYHQALISYQRALTIRPDNTLALAHQCAVLNELEQFEAAIAACEAALQGNNVWDGLGPAYGWSQTSAAQVGLGEYDAALASANRAIALNADYLGGWNNKAVSLWHLGRYAEALQAIDTERAILVTEPTMFRHRRQVLMTFNRGLILYALGRYQEAITAYSQAIDLQQLGQTDLGDDGTLVTPDFVATVWANLANAQLAIRQLPQATASAIAATQHNPTDPDAWYTLALTYFASSNYGEAWQAYQQAAQLQPERIDILIGQGLTLRRAGCPQAALQVFSTLLNLDPSNPVAHQEYRELLEEQQQPAANLVDSNPAARDAEFSSTATNNCTLPL